MMITVTWKLIGYDVQNTYQNQNNVITNVYYSIEATNGEQIAVHLDSMDLPLRLTNFVEISNLTNDDILNFVKNEFGSMTQEIEQVFKNKVDMFVSQGKNFVAAK
jgi:hypothetical protein